MITPCVFALRRAKQSKKESACVLYSVCMSVRERERERAGTLENVIVCVRCGEEKSD